MKFCSDCGSSVELRIPSGDSLPRHVCPVCNTIHYQNPKIVVGCIPEMEGKVLLCRRAIDPGYGLWTLPAGFMENSEAADVGAARETLEEACARVEIGPLYAFYNLPALSQVYLLFRGRLLDRDFCAGEETLEVGLFSESEVPWNDIAFTVVRETLRHYFEDIESGNFRFHFATI
ncbi:MAG: NUDIX hydrolase [Burkholderiales bacterium]|nr:NUDIX hydrolase [Burkholderiales bacterium]